MHRRSNTFGRKTRVLETLSQKSPLATQAETSDAEHFVPHKMGLGENASSLLHTLPAMRRDPTNVTLLASLCSPLSHLTREGDLPIYLSGEFVRSSAPFAF